jgi:2-polyprenyl-3-methyl-5-hydroxy-6-metoxy-1,4-benzoquinol methylase
MGGNNEVEIISQPQAHAFVEGWYEQNSESHFWFRWRLAAFLKQLKQIGVSIEKPYRALDVGCGVGLLRNQIESSTKWIVDATDLDLDALRRAKPGRGRKMYYDIFDQKEQLLEAYDLIVLFDVLEHIEDTQPFIKALLRHLKTQGLLLINVPALQSLYSHFDELVGHVRRYNKRTLASEFTNLGFEMIDIRYWGMSMLPALAVRKLVIRMMSGRSTAQKIGCGLTPPHPLAQDLFLSLMRLENVLPPAPIGTSLLMVGRKL